MRTKPVDTGLTLTQLKLFFVGVLIFFKLAPENNISHWSWWWVTAPLWIFDVILLIILAVLFTGTIFLRMINRLLNKGEDDG